MFALFSKECSFLRRVKINPAQNFIQFGCFKNAFNNNQTNYFMSKAVILITNYGRINICSIFQSLQPFLVREHLSGSKFHELQINKTCFKQHSSGPLRVEKLIPDRDLRYSQYLYHFPKAITFSVEPKLIRIKISCNSDNVKLLFIGIQRSTSCSKRSSL